MEHRQPCAVLPLLIVTILASLISLSHQHAYLAYPESRNYQAYLIPPPESKYYCPHCGQGGGTGRLPSMCGDPFQDVVGNTAFVPFTDRFYRQTTLDQGQLLKVRITVSTNHGGRMWMAICPLPRGQVTQDCFNKPENRLRRVNADPKYNNKWYWYLNTGNNLSAEETFKLPDGVSCDESTGGCMMQWWWNGYQSCTFPCEDSSIDVPGECGYNPLNPPVSTCSKVTDTETFANCADIVIRSSGGTPTNSPPPAAVVSSPPPPANVIPSPSPSPSPLRSPSPPPSPAILRSPPPPSPILSGDCPTSDWRCASCLTAAANNTVAASGLVASCYTCSTAASDAEAYACSKCMTTSSKSDVISGCLSCVAKGLPGWACVGSCAQPSFNGQQMNACSDCLATPGINTWGCQNCLQLSGSDTTKSSMCTTCVKAGIDGWTCGQCATKANSDLVAKCFNCLATAGGNTWPCIA